jgi:hypothetical protein
MFIFYSSTGGVRELDREFRAFLKSGSTRASFPAPAILARTRNFWGAFALKRLNVPASFALRMIAG